MYSSKENKRTQEHCQAQVIPKKGNNKVQEQGAFDIVKERDKI